MKDLYPLFEHMENEHGLILLQSELERIVKIVNKIEEDETDME